MRKSIVKCQLKDRDRFEQTLEREDRDLSPIYWLHDRIYTPRGYQPHANLPRMIMRTVMHAVDESPQYLLILRRHIEDSGLDIVEETPITDYVGTVNIIRELGFKEAGEVSRRRQELQLATNTTLYLDTLDNRPAPADFAKLETTLEKDASPIATKTSLISLLKTLGETDIIEKSYIEL